MSNPKGESVPTISLRDPLRNYDNYVEVTVARKPKLGDILGFIGNSAFLMKLQERTDSDVFAIKLFGKQVVIVADPAHLNALSQESDLTGRQGGMAAVVGQIYGEGIIDVATGLKHTIFHAAMKDEFSTEKIQGEYTEIFRQRAEELAAEFIPGQAVDVLHTAKESSFDVMLQTLCGVDQADPALVKQIVSDMQLLTQMGVGQYMIGLPITSLPVYKNRQQRLFESVRQIVGDGRKNGKYTLVAALYEACDAQLITPAEVVGNILDVWSAGHDTVSGVFAWSVYEMSQHPEVMEKLFAEVARIERGEISEADFYKENNYVRWMMNETMRMYPPTHILPEVAQKDIVIQGVMKKVKAFFQVKKGTNIFIALRNMHMNAKFWRNPEQFTPERFSHGKMVSDYFLESKGESSNAYAPFYRGPRRCIGQDFAIQEYMVFMTTLLLQLKRNKQKIVAKGKVGVDVSSGVLHPKNGIFEVVGK